MTNSYILLMAGSGTRSTLNVNKVLYRINNIPLFMYSLNKAYEIGFDEYILVTKESDYDEVKLYLEETIYLDKVKLIKGGATRSESVKNALKNVTTDVAFIHDAARPLTSTLDINKLIEESKTHMCGTLYHNVTDTVKVVTDKVENIDRNTLYAVTTPQFFNKILFNDIINNTKEVTDEITLFIENYEIAFVKETVNNLKLTTLEDKEYIEYLLSNKEHYLIGHSLDYHPFDKDKELILGGVIFPDYPILEGHSDGDVVYHAVAESLLGASALGDLGTLFPDTDMKYKGIDSGLLLKEVVRRVKELNFKIVNIDLMVYLIKPNLKNFKLKMAENIKELTGCENICVKAATLNKRGLIATGEGIGAEAIALIKK